MGEALLIVSARMGVSAAGDQRLLLVASLFLLGLGWNLGFVNGSGLLMEDVPVGAAVRLQGAADTLVWSTSAATSVSSGTDHGGGYALICVTGAALVLVPIAAFARLRPLAQPAAA